MSTGSGRRTSGMLSAPGDRAWRALHAVLAGEVVRPDSPAYDTVRRPALPAFHHIRPLAVVRCQEPSNVVGALQSVRRHRLPVVVRSGGHDFAGRSSSSGVVLDLAPLHAVALDGTRLLVGAGVRLGEVHEALDRADRLLPLGCGDTVGISGLTLGGGLGVLGRAHGLTCDHLQSAQVVGVSGRVLTTSRSQHPDLFCALRGGGAVGLGVVTRLEFATLPAVPVTSFRVTWPPAALSELVDGWQSWAPDAPESITADLELRRQDDDRGVTAELRGVCVGGRREAEAQLDDLARTVGADPSSVTLVHGSLREAKRHLADGEIASGFDLSRSALFARRLPRAAVDELIAQLTRPVAGLSRAVELHALGGAYRRTPVGGTAYAHRAARVLLRHTAAWSTERGGATVESARTWVDQMSALVRPWSTGGVYANFPEADHPAPERAYYGAQLARLQQIRATWDPDGLLRPRPWILPPQQPASKGGGRS